MSNLLLILLTLSLSCSSACKWKYFCPDACGGTGTSYPETSEKPCAWVWDCADGDGLSNQTLVACSWNWYCGTDPTNNTSDEIYCGWRFSCGDAGQPVNDGNCGWKWDFVCPGGLNETNVTSSSTGVNVGGGMSSTGQNDHCGCKPLCGWNWVCAPNGAVNSHGVPCCGWQWFCATPPQNNTQNPGTGECGWHLSCATNGTESAECIWNWMCDNSNDNNKCFVLKCHRVMDGSGSLINNTWIDSMFHGSVMCEWNQCSNDTTEPETTCGYRLHCDSTDTSDTSHGSSDCEWEFVCPSSSSSSTGLPAPISSSTGMAGGESSSTGGDVPPVGEEPRCSWCFSCPDDFIEGPNNHCHWRYFCSRLHNETGTAPPPPPPKCNWRYVCVPANTSSSSCTCDVSCGWDWFCGDDNVGGGSVSVLDTSATQKYCPTDTFLHLYGTGFNSQQIFDYTLTLTGAGCTVLHATTLVHVISSTELLVGPDGLTGCTGDIYATLNYQNQGALDAVKIASLSDTCDTDGSTGGGLAIGNEFNGVEHLTFNVISFLALVTLSVILAF